MAIDQKTSLWKVDIAYSGSIQDAERAYLGSITIVKNKKDAGSSAPDLKGFVEMKDGSVGSVVLWRNDKALNDEKQPKLTGKINLGSDLLQISLWKQEAEGGKPTYTGRIQSAYDKGAAPKSNKAVAADDDIDF